MNINEKVLQRFCNDYSLPIPVFSEPYFSHSIELLDPILDTKNKLKILYLALNNLKTIDKFLSEGNKISRNVIDLIKSAPSFDKFINMGKDDFTIAGVSSRQVYDKVNEGKNFISIDLKKANFNSLNLFGIHKEIGVSSYEDLISKFSDNEYFKKSKMLRQVIFGNSELDPRKQQRLQKYIISHLYSLLVKDGYDIMASSTDEIVLSGTKDIQSVMNTLSYAPDIMQFYRVESFSLKGLSDKPYFVKTITDIEGNTKDEFKQVPSQYFAQAVRLHLNQPLQQNDLVFSFEGIPSKMLRPVFPELDLECESPRPKVRGFSIR